MRLLIFLLFILSLASYALSYSTYGAPTEFGNATNTTCFIGGDSGILNCTGNITGNYFFGNGSQLSGITTITAQDLDCTDCIGTPEIADVYLELVGGTMLGNIKGINISANYFFGNGSNLTDVNASSVDCDNIFFSGTQGSASICDGDDAFGGGGGGDGAGKWLDIGLWLVPNATFAQNVNITGDLKIQDSGDFSCDSCINPADINDIDDEDIESDLNTYVDIAGDTMTGPLFSDSNINTSGTINASVFQISGTSIRSIFQSLAAIWKIDNSTDAFHTQYALTGYKKANLTLDYPNLDTDSTDDVSSVAAASPMSSTGGTTPTLSMTQADTSTTGYLTSTDWNTFNDKSTYTASDDTVGSITEWDSVCTDCVGTDDVATNACDNNCLIASPTFTSPIMTTPKVTTRITLDTAGTVDLGSATKEWGSVYIATNSKIFLGDGQEGEIYFDGTKMVIVVN